MFVQSGSGEGVRVTNPAKQFNWVMLSTVPILLVTHKEMYSIYCFSIIIWKMLKLLSFSKHANSEVQKPPSQLRFSLPSIIIILGGVYMRKLAPARVSYRDDFWILYPVFMMTGSFYISLFEGTLYVNKVYVWFKIANTTHALPFPVHRQTDFTPKRVVISRLHDTVARFRSGVKFSPRYQNRGELTPGWLAPAWHFVVAPCKQI